MSDKTYAETQGEAPFDWWKALENPPEIGTDEHVELTRIASQWVTCACGNQCAIIPRSEAGAPFDRLLVRLGLQFCDEVSEGGWTLAKDILKQIEVRSAILIAAELAKLNAEASI